MTRKPRAAHIAQFIRHSILLELCNNVELPGSHSRPIKSESEYGMKYWYFQNSVDSNVQPGLGRWGANDMCRA